MTQDKKPPLFNAALFLSAIAGCIAVIGYFLVALFYEQATAKIRSITNITNTEGTSPLYFAVFGLLYALSLLGVYNMYKLQRTGFWMYLVAQLAILLTPIVWLGKNSFSMTNTIFTVLFLLIYLSFYRRME